MSAYLSRIGAERTDDLATLVRRHYLSVPFETLSIHLGEPIDTRPEALLDKLVRRRRGGFCHELNGGFAWLLEQLGYRVEFLGARVHSDTGDTHPLSHVALRVTDDGGRRLLDVGFGGFVVGPVDLARPDQRVIEQEDGDLEVFTPDDVPGYRVETRARARADFRPIVYWQSTHPDSHFTRNPTCSLATPDGGRNTLNGTRLIRTGPDGARTEEELSDGEALAAYRDLFGIVIDRLPTPLYPQL